MKIFFLLAFASFCSCTSNSMWVIDAGSTGIKLAFYSKIGCTDLPVLPLAHYDISCSDIKTTPIVRIDSAHFVNFLQQYSTKMVPGTKTVGFVAYATAGNRIETVQKNNDGWNNLIIELNKQTKVVTRDTPRTLHGTEEARMEFMIGNQVQARVATFALVPLPAWISMISLGGASAQMALVLDNPDKVFMAQSFYAKHSNRMRLHDDFGRMSQCNIEYLNEHYWGIWSYTTLSTDPNKLKFILLQPKTLKQHKKILTDEGHPHEEIPEQAARNQQEEFKQIILNSCLAWDETTGKQKVVDEKRCVLFISFLSDMGACSRDPYTFTSVNNEKVTCHTHYVGGIVETTKIMTSIFSIGEEYEDPVTKLKAYRPFTEEVIAPDGSKTQRDIVINNKNDLNNVDKGWYMGYIVKGDCQVRLLMDGLFKSGVFYGTPLLPVGTMKVYKDNKVLKAAGSATSFFSGIEPYMDALLEAFLFVDTDLVVVARKLDWANAVANQYQVTPCPLLIHEGWEILDADTSLVVPHTLVDPHSGATVPNPAACKGILNINIGVTVLEELDNSISSLL